MCTELVKISRVVYSMHMKIANPLSILDVISVLKLCLGKACDISRDLKKIESIESKYAGLLHTYENSIDMYKNKNI